MKSYLPAFAPWLAFMVISSGNHPTRSTMLLACGVAFAASVFFLVPAAQQKLVSSLDIGSLIFFPFMAVLTLVLPTTFVDSWAPAISQIALSLIVGFGLLIGKPFTLVYAKAGAPPEMWDNPGFIATNKKLTVGWSNRLLDSEDVAQHLWCLVLTHGHHIDDWLDRDDEDHARAGRAALRLTLRREGMKLLGKERDRAYRLTSLQDWLAGYALA